MIESDAGKELPAADAVSIKDWRTRKINGSVDSEPSILHMD